MKLAKLLVLFFICASLYCPAQDYSIDLQNIKTCNGNFTDSQALGNYLPSEDYQTTICSFFETDNIQLSFTQFELAPGDVLSIYDGSNTSAPLIGNFQNSLSPGIILSSNNSCLTIVFNSTSSSLGAPGWNASIQCIDNCQTITSTITTTPATGFDGVVRICQGDTVSMQGSSNFSTNATGAISKFLMPDGYIINGDNATITLNDTGTYYVDYVVYDQYGCRDRTIQDLIINVSSSPDFTGTTAAENTICLGDTVELIGSVNTIQESLEVNISKEELNMIPDGTGVSWTSCQEVSGFPEGQRVASSTDISNILANMEHSFIGDVSVTLTSPDGTVVRLFNQSGSDAYLGAPINNNSNLVPGIGYDYNFNEKSTTIQSLDQTAISQTSNISIPSGEYRPQEPFSNFIGSPLNGRWCLEITDHTTGNNGFIFKWGLEFDPFIIPNVIIESPQTVQQNWQSSADIVSSSNNGTIINVQPTTAGEHCYTFEVLDSFGCIYVKEVCINVIDPTSLPVIEDYDICSSSLNSTTVSLSSLDTHVQRYIDLYIENYYLNDADAQTQNNPLSNAITLDSSQSSATITVRFTNVEGTCEAFQSITINLIYFLNIGSPTALESPDYLGNQTAVFDLTQNDLFLLGHLSSQEFTVSYYLTEIDAQTMSNPILNPSTFESNSDPQIVYGLVSGINGCIAYESFQLSTQSLGVLDTDGDGVFDSMEDLNGNLNLNDDDTDGDSIPNYLDKDDDNDTVPTFIEISGDGSGIRYGTYAYIDTDNNQVENYLDPDDDGDGILTALEDYDGNLTPRNDDTNLNNVIDYLDDTAALSIISTAEPGIKIFPTIVKEYMFIDISAFKKGTDLNFTLYNIQGKKVHAMVLNTNEELVKIDMSFLSTGFHLITIQNNGNYRQVLRLIKK